HALDLVKLLVEQDERRAAPQHPDEQRETRNALDRDRVGTGRDVGGRQEADVGGGAPLRLERAQPLERSGRVLDLATTRAARDENADGKERHRSPAASRAHAPGNDARETLTSRPGSAQGGLARGD